MKSTKSSIGGVYFNCFSISSPLSFFNFCNLFLTKMIFQYQISIRINKLGKDVFFQDTIDIDDASCRDKLARFLPFLLH